MSTTDASTTDTGGTDTGGTEGPALTPEQEARFWAKVDKGAAGGCWLWTGAADTRGHGRIWVNGRMRPAHRVSWRLRRGELPEGWMLRRTCGNGLCVNPDHLVLAHQATAQRERPGTRRPQQAGTASGHAKLTEEQVAAVRRRYAAGGVRQTALAREMGISHAAIAHVLSRRNWGHVP